MSRIRRRRLLAAIAVASLAAGVGTVTGALGALWTGGDRGPWPLAGVPADDPSRGLIYSGLVPAPKGDPCVGAYRLADGEDCSHGPDAPPPGLDVSRDVAPVSPADAASAGVGTTPADAAPAREPVAPSESDVARDAGASSAGDTSGLPAVVPDAGDGSAFAVGPNGVACVGDGVTGKRVQVLYVRDAGTASRFGQYLASFRTWAAGADAFYAASAAQTGGERHIRYVTTPDCQVDVAEVELPAGSLADFSRTISALRNLGYGRTDRKYMIFAESRVYCGIGTMSGDDQPGATNRNNNGSSYGRSDSGCWNAGVAAHELGHNLGAVQRSAPHATSAGHCWDESDLMCYNDGGVPNPPGGMQQLCPTADRNQVDCNHDDYFHTNPGAGNYLATHWNVANNEFLVRDSGGGGGGPTPSPSTRPTASPTRTAVPPSPSAGPSRTAAPPSPTSSPSRTAAPSPTTRPPSPTPSPTDGLKALQVNGTTSTTTRLAWEPAVAGTRYAILVNGRNAGVVRSARVTLVGLRPDTDYRLQVGTVDAAGTVTPYTVVITVHTRAATVPTPGSWFSLTNSLTGGAADLMGGRSADGTPLILYRPHGGANQLWRLEPAGGDTFLLRSRASDKCAAPRDGTAAAGSPLVQYACDPTSAAQRWRVASTGYGFALVHADDGLVIGVGRSRYGCGRVLVLQQSNRSRYQSWTASSG